MPFNHFVHPKKPEVVLPKAGTRRADKSRSVSREPAAKAPIEDTNDDGVSVEEPQIYDMVQHGDAISTHHIPRINVANIPQPYVIDHNRPFD